MERKYKNIEELMNQNGDAFNDQEPLEGHFDRFAKKLENAEKKNRPLTWVRVLKAAAIVVLVFFSSLYVYEHAVVSKPEQMQSETLPQEVQEAEMYYNSMVQTRYEQIERFDFKDAEQKQLLLKELKEMDEVYGSLKNELKKHPEDEYIINAMIMHYQRKVEVLNQIINQLKRMNQNQLKNNNYEDAEI